MNSEPIKVQKCREALTPWLNSKAGSDIESLLHAPTFVIWRRRMKRLNYSIKIVILKDSRFGLFIARPNSHFCAGCCINLNDNHSSPTNTDTSSLPSGSG